MLVRQICAKTDVNLTFEDVPKPPAIQRCFGGVPFVAAATPGPICHPVPHLAHSLWASAIQAGRLLPVPLTRCIQTHTPRPCGGLPAPALTCARWGVHLQDGFPDRGF